MSPPSPPSVALGVPLAVTVSSYAVDFLVKSSSGLFGLATKFEWRQFALTGPTLAIVDTAAGKVVHTFNASSVTLRQQAESLYVLESPSLKQALMVSAPSKTRMDKFRSALAAAASQDPTPPTDVDVLGSLLEVATVIVESEASTPSFNPSSIPFFKSRVAADAVLAHLAEMQSMYDLQSRCASMEALYVQLLDLEATYCRNPHVDNFCHTVHKLHPVQYARYTRSRNKPYAGPTHHPEHSIKSLVSRCPHSDCGYAFRPETSYSLHIKGQTMHCALCSRRVDRHVLKLAAFVRTVNSFVVECTLRGQPVTLVLEMPPMPSDGKLTSYLAEVRRRIGVIAPQGSRDGVQALQKQVRSTLQAFFSPSNELGSFSKLDLVHAMLRQLDFVNKVCPNMTYWSNPVVVEAAIHRYHKFLHLVRVKQVPGVTLVPTTDIDLVWHTHQCFPSDYASFCRKTSHDIFDHDDTIGGGDLQAGYADTFVLWSQTFNEPYSSHPPSYKAWVAKKNVLTNPMFKMTWRKHARVPSHDCRLVGVNESFPIDAILPFATAVEPDAAALDRAKQPVPDVMHVQVAVIGTPVMDGRVRLQYSRQNYLMEDGGLAAFVYFDASGSCGCGSTGIGLSMDAASGCASSTLGGGCGTIGGECGSTGCASSGGGGGCSSSTGGCGFNSSGGCGTSSSGGGGCGTSSSGGGCGSSSSGGGCGSSSTS